MTGNFILKRIFVPNPATSLNLPNILPLQSVPCRYWFSLACPLPNISTLAVPVHFFCRKLFLLVARCTLYCSSGVFIKALFYAEPPFVFLGITLLKGRGCLASSSCFLPSLTVSGLSISFIVFQFFQSLRKKLLGQL